MVNADLIDYLINLCKECYIWKNIHDTAYIFNDKSVHVVCDSDTQKIYFGSYNANGNFKSSKIESPILYAAIVTSYIEQNILQIKRRIYLNQNNKKKYGELHFASLRNSIANPNNMVPSVPVHSDI